jgi:acyl carrier protein
MDDFLRQLADILDVDSVNEQDELGKFSAWDSLAVLSIIAMASEQFHTQFSAQQIRSAQTAGDLFVLVRGNPAI